MCYPNADYRGDTELLAVLQPLSTWTDFYRAMKIMFPAPARHAKGSRRRTATMSARPFRGQRQGRRQHKRWQQRLPPVSPDGVVNKTITTHALAQRRVCLTGVWTVASDKNSASSAAGVSAAA